MSSKHAEIIKNAMSQGFAINGNQARAIAYAASKIPEKDVRDVVWNFCATVANKKYDMGLSKF